MNEHGGMFRICRLLLVVFVMLLLISCGKAKLNPPLITSADHTTFVEGIAGSFLVTTTAQPMAVLSSTGTLPTGVTFDSTTGLLSGTPATGSSGTYTLTITASNGNLPNATQTFTLTVNSAGNTIMIVHDGTTGTESNIVASLSTIVSAAGLIAGTSVGVPTGNLGALKQVWDVRYNTVMTQAEVTSYETCLSGGGTLVLIGTPVTGFAARNNSITQLINNLGGGAILVAAGNNVSQTVQAPFNTSITSNVIFPDLPGDAQGSGSGAFISQDVVGTGAGIYFAKNTLSLANGGRLMAVFDFNFLRSSDTTLKQLTTNMVSLP